MKRVSVFLSTAFLLTVILASAVADAPAEPNVSAGSVEILAPTASSAPDGTVWAAWVEGTDLDRVLVSSHGNGIDWTSPEPVTGDSKGWDAAPSLAFDADDVAWLAWSASTGDDDTLYLSRWTKERWTVPAKAPFDDTMPNRQPVIAAAPGGGLWLAWVGFDGNDDEIYAAFWDGRTWTTPQRVSGDDDNPEAYDTQPRLAVGPDATAWVVWTGYEGFLDDEVFASHWDGTEWSEEQRVSSNDDTVDGEPSLVVTDDGTAWLVWNGKPAGYADDGQYRIYASHWNETSGWSQEELISSPPDSHLTEERPSLALDSHGHPHVIWHVDDGGLGLGYVSYDGTRWSVPRWIVQEPVSEGLFVPDGDSPRLLWLSPDPSTSQPFNQDSLEDISEPLSTSAPPSLSLAPEWVYENRHMAFGDSITWGLYTDPATGQPVGDYPSRLEQMLDSRVVDSVVINEGLSGERTPGGRKRLYDYAWKAHHPEYVEIMEGTNDISVLRPYNAIADNLSLMVKDSKEFGSKPLLSTVLPRRDDLNDETAILNTYIRNVARQRDVPLVDNWQAFYDWGDWRSLLMDSVHPNTQGMVVLTNGWYNGLIGSYLIEDTIPPSTWMLPLPSQSECGQVTAGWNGSDNMSWVVDYDVQASWGVWSDWLLHTQATSAVYTGGSHNVTASFRVRGRDAVGNQSGYSSPVSTLLIDTTPPHHAAVVLPPAQKAPFEVRWFATDACDSDLRYDVDWCLGDGCANPAAPGWTNWQTSTPNTGGLFAPAAPIYGESYYFRARAHDDGGNSILSAPASTRLARFTVNGEVFTVRHEGILNPTVVATNTLLVEPWNGTGYTAYVADVGEVDLAASHVRFGPLPPMRAVSVTTDLTGIDLVLPPHDDAVQNGGFEGGTWGNWVRGGSQQPELSGEPHTGDGSALLGAVGKESTLSQAIAVPSGLTNPTLSFLVRLDDAGGASSTLQVQLANTSISHTQAVSSGDWVHVWIPVEAALGKNVSLRFTVSNNPAVHLDEVSLGSALHGVAIYLPIVANASAP